jgi:hypothetical protein
MLYVALVRATRSNQPLIIIGSSHRALCQSYGRLNHVLRLGVQLIKFLGHFWPTWPAPRSASSIFAISCTASRVGANPRASRSSICLIITSSSGAVSFFELGSQSHHAGFPARWSRSIDSGILYSDAIHCALGICVELIDEIARRRFLHCTAIDL